MKIIFFLLICFSFGRNEYFFKNPIQYNKDTKIIGEKGGIFHFSIIKKFDDGDKIYIEIHFKSENGCEPRLELSSFEFEDDDDEYKEYSLIPESLPNSRSGQCFYKYSIRLSDDISRIGFEIIPLYNSDNILYAKIYEESSILWIILLCVGLGIVLIGVGIGLFCYFYNKRKNKSVINEPLSPEIEPVFKPSIENSQN